MLLAACVGDHPARPEPAPAATIRFTFQAADSVDAAVADQHPTCVAAVGRPHLLLAWRGLERAEMERVRPGEWHAILRGVPVDQEIGIGLRAPHACPADPSGTVVSGLLANDVPLVRLDLVDDARVFLFEVDENGRVRP